MQHFWKNFKLTALSFKFPPYEVRKLFLKFFKPPREGIELKKVVWDIKTKFSPIVNFYENGRGAQFLSYTLQILWEFISLFVVEMLKSLSR